MRLILASASPRRAELLQAAGIPFEVSPAEVDERFQPGETPRDAVARVAEIKAAAAAERHPGDVVLAADTTVVVSGQVLGKPVDRSDAVRMLCALSGREHDVLTGVCVCSQHRRLVHVELTRVFMAALSDEEIEWYVATGEPADKAGAYAAQGLASRFVARIEGSYSNVVGLPIASVYRLLTEVGCAILGSTKSR